MRGGNRTQLKVFQIDSWITPEGAWTYNNSIPVARIIINGEPTTRKILSAMRQHFLLPKESKFYVDDELSYNDIWTIKLRNNDRPLFDIEKMERK